MSLTCKKCSQFNVPEARFCKSCGQPLQDTGAVVPAHGADPVTIINSVAEAQWMQPQAPSLLRRNRKLLYWGALVVCMLLVAAGAYYFITTSLTSASGRQAEKLPLLYAAEGSLFVVEKPGEITKLTDSMVKPPAKPGAYLLTYAQESSDGSTVCYFENFDEGSEKGDLFCKPKGIDAIRVASDVNSIGYDRSPSYLLTPDGRRVFYLTNYDEKSKTGDLSLYDLQTQQVEKVASSASPYLKVSPNGQTLLFIQSDSTAKDDRFKGDLYVKSVGSDKVKIDSDALYPVSVTDNAQTVAYAKAQSKDDPGFLYIKEKDKSPEKQASGLRHLVINRSHDQFIFLANYDSANSTADLYVKSPGKDKEKIAGDVKQLFYNNGSVDSYELERNLVYLNEENIADLFFYGKAAENNKIDLYVLANKQQEKIASGINGWVQVGNNGTMVAFLSNVEKEHYTGDLFVSRVVNGKTKEKEKIAGNVGDFQVSDTADLIYYMQDVKNDRGDLYVQNQNREPEKVTSDAYSFRISKDGKTALILTDYDKSIGELYVKEYGQEKKKLASDVYSMYSMDFEHIYYLKDWANAKGDLYMTGLDGNSTKLDSDVAFVKNVQ